MTTYRCKSCGIVFTEPRPHERTSGRVDGKYVYEDCPAEGWFTGKASITPLTWSS